jgi:hypothetical protein
MKSGKQGWDGDGAGPTKRAMTIPDLPTTQVRMGIPYSSRRQQERGPDTTLDGETRESSTAENQPGDTKETKNGGTPLIIRTAFTEDVTPEREKRNHRCQTKPASPDER